MPIAPLTCWLVLGFQGSAELVAGEIRAGTIAAGAQRIETRRLTESYHQTPAAAAFDLRVEPPGAYHIDLRTMAFDAYLVVRQGDHVLAEDDDGLIGVDARVVLELEPDVTYRVEACALHDGRGPFELVVESGVPEPWTPAERAALEVEHARERVSWAEGEAGADGALAGFAWNQLGEVLRRQGRNAEALQAHQRGFDLRRAALGEEHPDTLESLNNLALATVGVNDLERARELVESLLATRERILGPDHPFVALSLHNLSDLLRLQGEYELARQRCSRALSIFESLFGRNHERTINTMNTLAEIHKLLLDFDASAELFQAAIAGAEATLGRDHPLTGAILNNLGELYLVLGQPGEARPLLERAFAVDERAFGLEHPLTLTVQNNLAEMQKEMGDFDAARSLHERTLAIRERLLPPDHPDIVQSLRNLAMTLYQIGERERALELQTRSPASLRRTLGDQHPFNFQALINLGVTQANLGDWTSAEFSFREAIDGQERFPGQRQTDMARALHGLAHVVRRRDPAAALELFERALPIAVEQFGKGHDATTRILGGMIRTLEQLGQAERAWQVLGDYRGERQVRIGHILTSLTESERHAYMALLADELQQFLALAVSLNKPGDGYDALLEWKGRVLRLLLASRERLLADLSAEQCELVERLREVQASLSALALVESGPDPARRDARLEELAGERNRLELELVRSIEGGGDPGVTWPELHASLPAGAALVDFSAFERLLAFVLRPDRDEPTLLDLGPVEPIEAAVSAHRRALLGEAELGPSNETLRQLLWTPLAAELDDAELVFVCPDRFLGGLPFEVIRLPDGRYLVEERAFVYLEDASSLPHLLELEEDAAFDSLLACGGLSYDLSDVRGSPAVAAADFASALRGSFAATWNSLPGTLGEVDGVVEQFRRARGSESQVTRLTGPEASESRLKRELPGYRVLHLATHGFFEPQGVPSLWAQALDAVHSEEPILRDGPRRLIGLHPGLLSGLVCSGANRPSSEGGDDGYLTAEELQWLDLSGARLLVLSACETALGEPRSGDGMIGLRRACHLAGARTVISSLWSVTDDSPASLMLGFYENLWLGGMGPLEALRAAQLRLIAERKPPAAWGAFVLSGDWR